MRTIEVERVIYFFKESLPYLRVTLLYVAVSLVIGFMIGAGIVCLRKSKIKLLSAIGALYVTVIRCTPSIVLLFLVFYGLPAILGGEMGEALNRMPTIFFVCVTFSLFIGASSSEIIRSAYEAIQSGQREAGLSVGMSELQTFWVILLPQMVRKSIPNIGNMLIFLMKEGALAYTIGLRDVLGQAYYLSARNMNAYAIDMYIALTFIYWPLTLIIEKIFRMIEKKMEPVNKKRRAVQKAERGTV